MFFYKNARYIKLIPTTILFLLGVNNVYGEDFFSKEKIDISGYTKIAISSPSKKSTSLEIDDLSIFISGKFNKWVNPFIEAEIFDIPVYEETEGFRLNHASLVIERLYNDIHITEQDTFRIGKFLAPINRWNLIHAAPLVWTSNRPLTTKQSQANYITGFQFRHDFDIDIGNAIEFYIQPAAEFNHKPASSHPRQYETVVGGRWIINEDTDYYLGMAFQHAQVARSNEERNSVSFDNYWQHEWFELESELLFTRVDDGENLYRNNEWGGYLQLAVPLIWHFSFISRYEHFETANTLGKLDTEVVGMVYRPIPTVSFKVEWQETQASSNYNPTGLYSSIAIFF